MNDLLSRSFHGGSADLEQGFPSLEMADNPHFHAEIASLQSEMAKLRELLTRLDQTNEESRTVTSAQAMKTLRRNIDSLVAEILRKAKFIKSKLAALDKANEESRRIPGCEEGSAVERMRSTITNKQRDDLRVFLQSFDSLRQKLQEEYKDTIKRRYYTITGEKPSEDVIDRMIATGESETFLQKAVQQQGRGHVLDTIVEIQERHDAVQQIEKNLLELHQIFMDMAVLVDEQGAHLKTIEEAVDGARTYIGNGTTQLAGARRLQKNTRKWACIAMLILLIIIIIAVVLLIKLLN